MRTRTILIALGAIAAIAALALIFIPRLLKPKPEPVAWPTQGWPTTTPEEAGLDSGKLAEGLQALREQNTQIDSLMVIRDGKALLEASFYPLQQRLSARPGLGDEELHNHADRDRHRPGQAKARRQGAVVLPRSDDRQPGQVERRHDRAGPGEHAQRVCIGLY